MKAQQKYIVEEVLPDDQCAVGSQSLVRLSPIGDYTAGEWEPKVGEILVPAGAEEGETA